jgi:hypothetical protein
MNNKIELYLLDGCDRCSRIKYALLADEIKYEEVNCTSSESSKCDSLEDKLDCGRYPMAVVKKKGVTSIIYFCEGKSTSVTATTNKRISVDSEDKFINEIKKAYF